MPLVLRLPTLLVVSLSLLAAASSVEAQYFGRNKVEYVDFDFRVFATEHFDIYHYPAEEPAARLAARLAERWYARLSRALDHELNGRQPLVLYGSHPEFTQTNVVASLLGEGIGGVTESGQRRIVMPFAPTLAETDHVLGHEISHAFQFDLISRYKGRVSWPGWFIEGMAQYLSLGAVNDATAMWLRDAAVHELLPEEEGKAARRFSPYRYGHAFWAYLTARFGDGLMSGIFRDGTAGNLGERFKEVTGADLDELFADWRAAVMERYGDPAGGEGGDTAPVLLRNDRVGKLQIGPAVSPDGRHTVFFSERDKLSLDLFLADADDGAVTQKLATTAANPRFESLQAIRSAGAWSPDGTKFVFAAISQGRPLLVVIDMRDPGKQREISLTRIGQVLTPSWAPDGRRLVFSILEGGTTDLFVYELETGAIRQLTDDAYADLQPAWSPNGGEIVFATDRFSTDLSQLTFGRLGLAAISPASGSIRRMPVLPDAEHLNPQWSSDGHSVYFIADPDGVSNVYRLERHTSRVFRVTDVAGGVTGLSDTSPALSVASDAPVLAYSVYRGGKYRIERLQGETAIAGTPCADLPALPTRSLALAPVDGADSIVAQVLHDPTLGLIDPVALEARAYRPDLSLEAIGHPYVSSGGGAFGGFLRAGGSLLFGDLLGERKLLASVQAGSRLRDLALGLRFLNRERRWNWGALAELEPSLRRLPRQQLIEVDGQPALATETTYYLRMQGRIAGLLAYPLNRAQRLEFTAGLRHARYQRDVRSRVRAIPDGHVIRQARVEHAGGAPASVGEVTAAFVGDTSVFGPTSPILGGRYRVEVAPTFGSLSLARVLVDYRRYLMPVRPYTIAGRLMHMGQYGTDAADPRLLPTFIGSRYFVRGYGWSDIRCQWNAAGECAAMEEMLGNRVVVANLEWRTPLLGVFSRELEYGPVPAEAFVFADAGLVWGQRNAGMSSRGHQLVRSIGAGVRVNAMGLPLEVAAVRALDAPARGWSFDFSFRPGF